MTHGTKPGVNPFAAANPDAVDYTNSTVGVQAAPISRHDVQREMESLCQLENQISADPVAAEYQAISTRTNEKVVVTVLARRFVDGAAAERRLRKALGMSAGLDHPNISPVLGFGATTNFIWFSRRIVAGQTLQSLVEAQGGIPFRRIQRVAQQVAAALDHAHRRGVTHGTLSATNILVMENDWVAVRDFAVGTEIERLRRRAEILYQAAAAGVMPDVQVGRDPDPMDDQYALASVVNAAVSESGHAALPHHVEAALRRAMREDRAERFPTTLQFVAALSGPELASTFVVETRADVDVPDDQQLLFVDAQPSSGAFRRILVGALLIAIGAGGTAFLMKDRPAEFVNLASGDVQTDAISPISTAAIDSTSIPPKLEPYKSAAVATNGAREPVTEQQKGAATAPVSRNASAAPNRGGRANSGTNGNNTSSRGAEVPPVSTAPGRLFVSSRPWGRLFVDDRYVGNTNLGGFSLPPGPHRVRIVRTGFMPLQMDINITSGNDLRLIDLILQENR